MTDWGWLTLLASAASAALSGMATLHVLLTKEEPRSAIGWIGIVWLSPFLGTILYAVFGVNRIQRRARIMKRMRPKSDKPFDPGGPHEAEPESVAMIPDRPQFRQLAQLIGQVTELPLLEGNAVTPLIGGDHAYARMLDAIRGARSSIGLVSYIFRDDRAGNRFVQALRQAQDRGVEVRVLIDDLGARHGGRSAIRSLRKAGIPTTRFIPAFAPFWLRYLNLRNHRKILVIDGKVGFTGGLNIDESFLWEVNPRTRKQDIHFEIQGPAVASLRHTFAEDWHFAAGEDLRGPKWFGELEKIAQEPRFGAGMEMRPPQAACRGIIDGPDDDLDKALYAILGALSVARKTAKIVTPYFLPETSLMTALNVAAMRGVEVDIVLPFPTNSRLVQWAMQGTLDAILVRGCRVWFSPPPFDHSKIFTVDSAWSFVGSANWDARSLRLNFEFNLECYDAKLGNWLDDLIQAKIAKSRPLTSEWLGERSPLAKIRDAAARLLTPYL